MSAPTQILTHEFAPFCGGIGVYAGETASAISRLGGETTVWAPDYRMRLKDPYPYTVRRVPMRGRQDWGCRFRMALALKSAFIDGAIPGTVILAEPGPIRMWMYHRWFRLPKPGRLALVLHGSEVRLLTQATRRRRRFRNLLRETAFIGVVSETVRRQLLECYPDLEDSISLVPGAVRSRWAPLPPVAFPDPGGPLEILQVGRIHPRKGQHLLVEAASSLPEELGKRIRIRLVGPVSRKAYANQVRRCIRETRVNAILEGVLTESDLRAAYGSASLVVMPSQPFETSIEGLGLALLEGQHFGRPVIGTRIGGIPEALLDQESGILVPPDDPAALGAAMRDLLADPDRCRHMGHAGAAFVRHTFSWEANARKLLGDNIE